MRIHDAGLAGRWYPSDPERLRAEIERLLAQARRSMLERPRALVVPHAAYLYSGRAAAHGYLLLREEHFERVLVLAPSHFVGFRGAATLAYDAFRTPLGFVAIDGKSVQALTRCRLVREYEAAFAPEHSLEIQLPFLQVVLPGIPVVPLLIGWLSRDDVVELASALQPWYEPQTLILVSSDFTHYGASFDYLPFAPTDPATVRARLHELDGGALSAVCSGDVDALDQYLERTGATVCGRYPLLTFLGVHRRRSEGRILCYYTSLDVTGDHEHVVSYAAVGFPEPELA